MTTADDVTRTVDVQAATVFEAAAAGLARFRDQGWVEPLAPTAVIRVEAQVAPVVHSVPLKALER